MSPSGVCVKLMVMSHTITLDTLEYANQLKSVGVPDKQAEKFATLQKKRTDEICAFIDDSLATKKDIEELKSSSKKDIEELKLSTKKDIKVVLWVIGISFTVVGLINVGVGILITFHK